EYAAQRSRHDWDSHPLRRHGAAGGVRGREDADLVRPGPHGLTREALGDLAADGGGAVHGRDHADVVAGGGATVGAAEAFEEVFLGFAGPGRFGHRRTRARPGEAEVVGMDVVAGRYGLGGDADELAVLEDRGALRDGNRGELVTGRDRRAEREIQVGQG